MDFALFKCLRTYPELQYFLSIYIAFYEGSFATLRKISAGVMI